MNQDRLKNVFERLLNNPIRFQPVEECTDIHLLAFERDLNLSVPVTKEEFITKKVLRDMYLSNREEFVKYINVAGFPWLILCADGRSIAEQLQLADSFTITWNPVKKEFGIGKKIPYVADGDKKNSTMPTPTTYARTAAPEGRQRAARPRVRARRSQAPEVAYNEVARVDARAVKHAGEVRAEGQRATSVIAVTSLNAIPPMSPSDYERIMAILKTKNVPNDSVDKTQSADSEYSTHDCGSSTHETDDWL